MVNSMSSLFADISLPVSRARIQCSRNFTAPSFMPIGVISTRQPDGRTLGERSLRSRFNRECAAGSNREAPAAAPLLADWPRLRAHRPPAAQHRSSGPRTRSPATSTSSAVWARATATPVNCAIEQHQDRHSLHRPPPVGSVCHAVSCTTRVGAGGSELSTALRLSPMTYPPASATSIAAVASSGRHRERKVPAAAVAAGSSGWTMWRSATRSISRARPAGIAQRRGELRGIEGFVVQKS